VEVAWLYAAGQGQLAGLADIEGPQHAAHADPQRAGHREVGDQLFGEVLVAPAPKVFVVAQFGVLGGKAVRELGGESLLFAVPRPGAPLLRVVVELFVDACGRAVGIAGVDADDAFVVVGDDRPGQLAGAHRQPVFGVDRLAEVGDCATEIR
jgi:hypothetical protein